MLLTVAGAVTRSLLTRRSERAGAVTSNTWGATRGPSAIAGAASIMVSMIAQHQQPLTRHSLSRRDMRASQRRLRVLAGDRDVRCSHLLPFLIALRLPIICRAVLSANDAFFLVMKS